MMADGWDFIRAGQYRPLIGEPAWAEYGRCVEAAYAKLPPRAPRRNSHVYTEADSERSQLAGMLTDWYSLNDDLDALLALKVRELAEPWDYANLVRQNRDYGRHREALEWAEKALLKFPDDARLYQLLGECYRHDGCDEEAEKLLWHWFEKWPSAQHFFELMKRAGKQGTAWRKRAFDDLEQCEACELKRRQPRDPKALRDVNARLAILLHEKKIDEAVAISRNAEASGFLILDLAEQARDRYPEVSIPVFRDRIARLVDLGGIGNYEEAAGYLGKLLPLLDTPDRALYMAELRGRYKAKRNFMKLLEVL
jgi:tetratricopeptide (TPR) repeat protein